jgi:SepF-like predicted cell division protein (DUF552 family)
MVIRDLLRRVKKEEEIVELPVEGTEHPKIQVRIDNLSGSMDVERIVKLVREGNIMFLKVKDLQKRDIGQFKTAVHRLKRFCTQYGWDLVGIEDGYLIVTPRFGRIVR